MARNNIAQLRKEHGLNQRELSEKLGVVQATVSAWETGRNEPDNDTLQKIADLFYVNFGYVAGYEQRKKTCLTDEEYHELVRKKEEKALEKEIELHEKYGYLSPADVKEIEEQSLYEDFEKNGKGLYIEAFQFNNACEYMSASQRKRALDILKVAFPNAFQSSYDPD